MLDAAENSWRYAHGTRINEELPLSLTFVESRYADRCSRYPVLCEVVVFECGIIGHEVEINWIYPSKDVQEISDRVVAYLNTGCAGNRAKVNERPELRFDEGYFLRSGNKSGTAIFS